jgi:SAM-dependent methyltransferase
VHPSHRAVIGQGSLVDEGQIRDLTSVEDRHWWYRERRAIIKRQLAKIGKPGKAIEIGAAGGGNCRTLADNGWDVLATEYLEAGVEVARSRGLNAIQADARDLPVDSESFDLVVAFDMLEHVEEDYLVTAEIMRILRPGGTALIAVPADMRLWSAHDVMSAHFRRYDRDSLTKVIEGAGLVIDELWSWNVLLRPAMRLRRKGTEGAQNDRDIVAVNPIVNAALGAIVTVERYLPVKSLPGVSLMLRAHRPA